MRDIFDTKIVCEKCNVEMKKEEFIDKGVRLRSVKCSNCGERIIHPQDLSLLNHFNDLKNRNFVVKLRVVGNSHTISIPKEMVDFINEQRLMDNRMRRMKKQMDDMVKLCFEDFGRISLIFGGKNE